VATIKILLADDHALVRQGTRELLDPQEDLEVIAEAGDGEEAVRMVDIHRPDVAILDISMPKLNGIEATERIKRKHPATAVLILTAYDDDQYIFGLLEAGAAGYLLKDVDAGDLIKAIRAVHAGESVLHPAITRKVVDRFTHPDEQAEANHALEQLTEREFEVLKLAAKSLTNREIADALCITVRTVQVHMSNIFGKMGVGSRTEAVLSALRRGWIALEDTV
jgi:DNA-binding NarL/FixJ family response regulator